MRLLVQVNEEKAMGLIPNGDFYDYVRAGRFPTYNHAQRQYDHVSEQVEQMQYLSAGPMSDPLRRDKANVAKGQNEDRDYPG